MSEANFDPYTPPEAEIGQEVADGPPWPAWLMIFFRPRATIRRIIDSGRTAMFVPLMISFGAANTFAGARERYRGRPVWLWLVDVLVAGPIKAILFLYFFAFLIRLIGRWFGGSASQKDLRTAMAWASIPLVALLASQCLNLMLFDTAQEQPSGIPSLLTHGLPQPVTNEPPVRPASRVPSDLTFTQAGVLISLLILPLIATGWAYFLWVRCVAEAHRFSWVKSLAVGLLGYLIWLVMYIFVAEGAYRLGIPL